MSFPTVTTHDTSEIVDLEAICQRPNATPVRDLTPPDLRNMGAFTTDLDGEDPAEPRARAVSPKRKIALVAIASAALAVLGVSAVVAARSGPNTSAKQPAALAKMPPPPATVAAPEAPPGVTSAPAAPSVSSVKLPPPPTTGAPTVAHAPPSRAFRPSAQRKTAAAPAGPKMTKVQSAGVASR